SNVVSDVKYGLITYWPGVLLASRVARQHPMEVFYECDFFGKYRRARRARNKNTADPTRYGLASQTVSTLARTTRHRHRVDQTVFGAINSPRADRGRINCSGRIYECLCRRLLPMGARRSALVPASCRNGYPHTGLLFWSSIACHHVRR